MIWSIVPIYNMVMIALDAHGDVFSDAIWPPRRRSRASAIVVTEGYWYLEHFWHQFGNSFYVGLSTMFLTLADRLAGQLHRSGGCGCATAGC